MSRAIFIDTSVLLNVLDVPKNNQHHHSDIKRFSAGAKSGATLILPVTTIIETGNTVAKAGHHLHEVFIAMLRAAAGNEHPWVATTMTMDADFLRRLLEGDGALTGLGELLTSRVGTGDATILHEVLAFRRRVPASTAIEVWTHDQQLQAQASLVTT
jgi:hypothetical protein